MLERIHETVQLIDKALNHWLPHKVFIAYSGGRDSAVVMDIMKRLAHKRLAGVMSIDTELAADGWQPMIRAHCAAVGLPLEVVRGHGFKWGERKPRNVPAPPPRRD